MSSTDTTIPQRIFDEILTICTLDTMRSRRDLFRETFNYEPSERDIQNIEGLIYFREHGVVQPHVKEVIYSLTATQIIVLFMSAGIKAPKARLEMLKLPTNVDRKALEPYMARFKPPDRTCNLMVIPNSEGFESPNDAATNNIPTPPPSDPKNVDLQEVPTPPSSTGGSEGNSRAQTVVVEENPKFVVVLDNISSNSYTTTDKRNDVLVWVESELVRSVPNTQVHIMRGCNARRNGLSPPADVMIALSNIQSSEDIFPGFLINRFLFGFGSFVLPITHEAARKVSLWITSGKDKSFVFPDHKPHPNAQFALYNTFDPENSFKEQHFLIVRDYDAEATGSFYEIANAFQVEQKSISAFCNASSPIDGVSYLYYAQICCSIRRERVAHEILKRAGVDLLNDNIFTGRDGDDETLQRSDISIHMKNYECSLTEGLIEPVLMRKSNLSVVGTELSDAFHTPEFMVYTMKRDDMVVFSSGHVPQDTRVFFVPESEIGNAAYLVDMRNDDTYSPNGTNTLQTISLVPKSEDTRDALLDMVDDAPRVAVEEKNVCVVIDGSGRNFVARPKPDHTRTESFWDNIDGTIPNLISVRQTMRPYAVVLYGSEIEIEDALLVRTIFRK